MKQKNKKPLLNICHILSSLGVGGMENGVVNLINNMSFKKFHHTIICLYGKGDMAKRIKNPRVKIYNLLYPDGLSFKLPFHLKKIIRLVKPDIVHTRNYSANLYGTLGAKLAKVPIIVNSEHGSIQSIVLKRKLVSRAISFFAKKILCVSSGLENYLIEQLYYPQNKIHSITNGVDAQKFRDFQLSQSSARKLFGIPEDVWLIGTVGRFSDCKDHFSILSLLKRVSNVSGRPLHGIIVGDGENFTEFKELVQRNGLAERLHLPGNMTNIHKFYSIFDIFFLLSTGNEGTSNVLLEAMSSKIPVIVSDIVGNKKIIQQNWNGLIVPAHTESKIKKLEKVVPMLLLDKKFRNKLINNSSITINKYHSLDTMVANYSHFYSSLVEKAQ